MTRAREEQWADEADRAWRYLWRTRPVRKEARWLGQATVIDLARSPYLPWPPPASWKRGVWA